MHHIYHTEGIILGSRNYGESGKYYYLFTRDLGMITAAARGVRKMPSKLRYILSDFSYIKTDLVRGKDFWRITSASKTNTLEKISKHPETLRIFAGISRLLRKLLAGEEPNTELFDDLLKGLEALEKCSDDGELRDIEAVVVLRVLYKLGYVGADESVESLARSPFAGDMAYRAASQRKKILSEINKALRESMLYGA